MVSADMVPVLSIVFMIVSCTIAFMLPIALLLYLSIAKKADIMPFFIGCAVMILFAFVLEQLIHRIVLGSLLGETIRSSTLLYAVYGGLMAGLFEETGRFLAMSTVLKKYHNKNINAYMYGAGHGGIEAIVVLGLTSINNIIYSVLINTGNTALLTGKVSGDILAQLENAISLLKTTPSLTFLMGGIERISAVILHLGLSVFVWFAVKDKKKRWLFPAAILMHALVDALTVILSRNGVPVPVLEGVVGILALEVFFLSYRQYRAAKE